MIYVAVLLIQLTLFLILIFLLLFFLSMVISDFFGVPFVPTRDKSLPQIFDRIKIKPSDCFYDLGCGDGRLVFFVNNRYKIRAIGIELNPLLNLFTNLKKQLLKKTSVSFEKKNFFDVNLQNASIIYLFLFPEVVEKLKGKLLSECRKGTVIVSHGFEAKFLKDRQFDILTAKPFTTYYYRL